MCLSNRALPRRTRAGSVWLSASRHRSASEAAEAPRCVSAIAYKPVAASALQLRAPSLRCHAARPRTRHGRKKKKHGAQVALQAARKCGRKRKKKTRRQPLIRAPAHLLARWVLGHEDCDGSTSGYGEGRCAQGRNETAAAPHEPTLSASALSFSSLMPANGLEDGVYHTMRGFGPPIYSLAGSERPSRVLLEGLDPRWQQSHF